MIVSPMTEPDEQPMTIIQVEAEPIDLVKVIKLDSEVSGGGEAKMILVAEGVLLNGEPETRKRKKVYHGDIIQYRGKRIRVVVNR